jgi:asparagine synthase (glutamine-hydrolysing)
MCGIAGVVDNQQRAESSAATERMIAALLHRGPDSHGVQNLGPCVLGNTRLAIVDLSERGHMPMCNEDSTVWITYNGECYNAAELRPSLIALGHRFRSTTDTEVVVHLYEEYGDRCVEKLRGMFAFAIWDVRRRKLLLARDRLGIKPLYYNYSPGSQRLLFASEIKGLLASQEVARKIEPSAIRAFLQLGHVPPPWTAIQGVKPLEPGHLGIWQDGNFQTNPYWRLPSSNGHRPDRPEQTAANLREILLRSSREQLMSDVPVALFLSGGTDSAVLGALMKSAGTTSLTALTIGFEEDSFDESQQSQQTAQALGIPQRTIRLPASRMGESLDHALWAMDQPTVDGLNAYWISKAAAEAGFKVALSGQGGDELFGGYASHEWFERFSRVANWLRPVSHIAGSRLLDRKSFPFRWRKLSYLFGADDPFVAAQLAVRVQFLESDVCNILNPALAPPSSVSEAADCIRGWAEQTSCTDLRERIAFVDFPAHLEARLLRDGDAMSMAHSLEVRPVMLDHTVVEHVLSLPPSIRLQKKRLLLDATRECMPDSLYSDLLARPKRTFTFPFSRWISGDLRPTIEAALDPDRLSAVGVLNPDAVARLWKRYLENPAAVGWSRVWTIFVLARWCEIMQVKV